MFKRAFIPSLNVALYAAVEYGTMDSCPIDQTPVSAFNIDPETGRPESDITKILRAQTKFEQEKLYKELVERPVPVSEMTAEQIRHEILYGRPRLAQSPSELADYAEQMQQKALDDAENARKKELSAMRREVEDDMIKERRKSKQIKTD